MAVYYLEPCQTFIESRIESMRRGRKLLVVRKDQMFDRFVVLYVIKQYRSTKKLNGVRYQSSHSKLCTYRCNPSNIRLQDLVSNVVILLRRTQFINYKYIRIHFKSWLNRHFGFIPTTAGHRFVSSKCYFIRLN